MITKLPADRPLPHRQEILERVLADNRAPARHRRGWLVPVSAAASIALVAGGVLIATNGNDKAQPPPAATPTPSATPAPKKSLSIQADVHINLGRLTVAEKAKAAQDCLHSIEGPDRATAVVHAVKVMSWKQQTTESTVAFTAAPGGLVYGCVGNQKPMDVALVGGDPKVAAKEHSAVPRTDATHPAAPAEGGPSYGFVEFDRKPDLLVKEGWYGVDDRVASMRQRWVVRGKPGPWYVAEPADGLVFLRSWDRSAALKLGEKVQLETQVLDHDGTLLDAPATLTGHGLTPSPGTTRVDRGTITQFPGDPKAGNLELR